MPRNSRPYRTKKDLSDIRELAESLRNIDVSNLAQIERHLNNYIRSNQNSRDPEKKKKVDAAKILLPVFKANGIMASIKQYMGEAADTINADLAEMEEKNAPDIIPEEAERKLIVDMAFNHLSKMVINGKSTDITQIENAFTTFMESDNFAEYHSDSPLRKMTEPLKACVNAYHGYEQVWNGADQKRFLEDHPTPVDSIKNAWKDHSVKFVEPLIAAYGDNLSLTNAEDEIKTLPSLVTMGNEIEDLWDEYGAALEKETIAQNDLKEYENEIKSTEKEYDKEIESSVKGEKLKLSQEEKKLYLETLASLSLAYDKTKEGLSMEPPVKVDLIAEGERDRKALEDATQNLERVKQSYNTDHYLDSLLSNAGADKEASSIVLKNFINENIKAKQEEEKWLQINANYTTFRNAFGDDTVIMNFLISGDRDLAKQGLDKLENEYHKSNDPEKQTKYEIAATCQSNILNVMNLNTEEVFNFDGKGDQKQYMEMLDKKLSKKPEEVRYNFGKENQILRAYTSYKKTKNDLKKVTSDLQAEAEKGENADVNRIAELNENLKKLSDRNSEYQQKLMSVKINDPELVKEAQDFALRKVNREKDDIKVAEDNLKAVRKKAKDTVKTADKLKNAIVTAKKSPMIMQYKEIAAFINILESKDPDYSKMPASNQVFQDAYDQKEVNIKNNRSRKAEELGRKLVELNEKKKNAEEVLKNKKSDEILEKVTQKAIERDKLAKKYEKLQKQDTRMKGLIIKTKEYFKPKYNTFKQLSDDTPRDMTQGAYKRIYEEIEKFKGDFSKCMRDDYARSNGKKNSTEYKAIMTALNAFGTEEEFNKLTAQQVAGKLGDLKKAATDYKAKKLDETRLIWSHQRRYRLDYADRIAKFADGEQKNLPILERIDEKNNTKQIKDLYDEFENLNPNGMTKLPGGGEKVKENSMVMTQIRLKQSAQRIVKIQENIDKKLKDIDQKMKETAAPLNTNADNIKDEDLAVILLKLDTLRQMKEKLRDPDLLAENGVDKHITAVGKQLKDENFNKYIKDKMDNVLEGDKYREMASRMDKTKIEYTYDPNAVLDAFDKSEMKFKQKKLATDRMIANAQSAAKYEGLRNEAKESREKDLKDRKSKKVSGEDSKGLANEIIENKTVSAKKKIKPAKKILQI